jgi:hypothetical protein
MLVPPPSGDALSHGLAMITAPVVFGLLGAFLDRRVDTAPIFLLLFAVFGVAASFASAYYRYEARVAHDETGKPWTRRGAAEASARGAGTLRRSEAGSERSGAQRLERAQ